MPTEADAPEEKYDDEMAAVSKLAYEAGQGQLDDQAARFRGFLSRLPVTAALVSVIIGFFAVAFALAAQDPSTVELILAAATIAGFLASIACTTIAMQKTLSNRGPSGEEMLMIGRDAGEIGARLWAIEMMARAYTANEPVLTSVKRWSRAAQVCAFIDALFAVATVAVALLD